MIDFACDENVNKYWTILWNYLSYLSYPENPVYEVGINNALWKISVPSWISSKMQHGMQLSEQQKGNISNSPNQMQKGNLICIYVK